MLENNSPVIICHGLEATAKDNSSICLGSEAKTSSLPLRFFSPYDQWKEYPVDQDKTLSDVQQEFTKYLVTELPNIIKEEFRTALAEARQRADNQIILLQTQLTETRQRAETRETALRTELEDSQKEQKLLLAQMELITKRYYLEKKEPPRSFLAITLDKITPLGNKIAGEWKKSCHLPNIATIVLNILFWLLVTAVIWMAVTAVIWAQYGKCAAEMAEATDIRTELNPELAFIHPREENPQIGDIIRHQLYDCQGIICNFTGQRYPDYKRTATVRVKFADGRSGLWKNVNLQEWKLEASYVPQKLQPGIRVKHRLFLGCEGLILSLNPLKMCVKFADGRCITTNSDAYNDSFKHAFMHAADDSFNFFIQEWELK